MVLKLRLARMGKRHSPFYNIGKFCTIAPKDA